MQSISKNRSFLMGISILLIMFCHNSLRFDAFGETWSKICSLAECGVDIFLLLSGYGLFHSFSKDEKYLPFIQRRVKALFLPYLIVVIPYIVALTIYNPLSFKNLVWEFSLISFFVDGVLRAWYIAAIFLLYMLFPLFYRIGKSKYLFFPVCVLLWGLAVSLNLIFHDMTPIRLISEVFIARIPTFIIGIKIAQLEREGKRVKASALPMALLMTAVSLAVCICIFLLVKTRYLVWIRISFCFLSLGICYTLSDLRPKLNKHIDKGICFLGGITLWIYLIHEKFLYLFSVIYFKIFPKSLLHQVMINVIAVVLTVAAAAILARALQFVQTKRKRSALSA